MFGASWSLPLVLAACLSKAHPADASHFSVEDSGPDALVHQRKASPMTRRDVMQEPIRGTRGLIVARGYPVEEHTVRTADGYQLTVFRIPRAGSPVVFLQHGIFSSSADFVTLGRHDALGFVLHDAGFDVWLGNSRGNTASRRHESLRTSDPRFWDFSWHEMGTLDLPACIDFALDNTGQSQLHYIGHSQGTTDFFVMASERPEYMLKIKTLTCLGPAVFMRGIRSAPFRLLCELPYKRLSNQYNVNEFFPFSESLSRLGKTFCSDAASTQPLCVQGMFLLAGNSQQINKTILPDILANLPAGSSAKQLVHFCQLIKRSEDVFRQFDYGPEGNQARYGRRLPPDYDLSRATPPTYIVYADNDILSVKSGVDELVRRLPNIAPNGLRRISFPGFNHFDFTSGKNAKELVYDDIVSTLQSYEAADSSFNR